MREYRIPNGDESQSIKAIHHCDEKFPLKFSARLPGGR
jgi:hypothetical protein